MSIFTKETWENRNVQYPKRRRFTEVDGQPNIYDVDREEGTIVAEGSAFSAENMNGLETRIETAFNSLNPVVLYSNESGTGNTITLSDSSANYKFIDVFFGVSQGWYSSIRIYNPNGKSLDLCDILSENKNYSHVLYIRSAICNINGNTISFLSDKSSDFDYKKGEGVIRFEVNNICYIRHVIGYKPII